MSEELTKGERRAVDDYLESSTGGELGVEPGRHLVDGEEGLVAVAHSRASHDASRVPPWKADNNARRLAACWNFCVGVPTEDLESAGAGSLAASLRAFDAEESKGEEAGGRRREFVERHGATGGTLESREGSS